MTDFFLLPIIPEIFLALVAMGLLIVGVTGGNKSSDIVCWAGGIAVVLAMMLLFGTSWDRQTILNGMFVIDEFGSFIKLLALLGILASLTLSVHTLHQDNMARFEFPVLILLAGLGMMLMISAHNMLALYMGLELQSLSLYVLAAFRRNSLKSAEAGAKYFILGALSSGLLLFGISLVYGFTGTIDYAAINKALAGQDAANLGAVVGMVFILAGVAFKISAVPFHMWTPDVYQGAPTAVTAFFAIVPKIAAMAMLIRLIYEPFAGLAAEASQIIIFLSVASMTVGAFAALTQNNIKRLMAYSSIGNMGYALIGVAAGTAEGLGAVILYMAIYLAMTAGAFAFIMCMRRDGISIERISDLAGLSRINPWLAYAMAILMFSMSGIPPLAGFFGKMLVFKAAIAADLYVLAVYGILTSVVAAFYYLRIIKVMFFDESADPLDRDLPFSRRAVLFISVLFLLGFTIKPNFLVIGALGAASGFFPG